MSTEIEKGSRSYEEIARALEGMKVGIICLTPENLTSEWLHYEAGALSKTLDANTRVCTYLLADLDFATVKPPLAWFHWTKANKTDTRRLIGTINQHLDAAPLAEAKLDSTFEKWWPDLEQKLKALPPPSSAPPAPRRSDDMIAELLELARNMAPAIAEIKEETDAAGKARKATAMWQAAVKQMAASNVVLTRTTGHPGGIGAAFGEALGTFDAPPAESSAEPSKMPPIPFLTSRPDKK